MSNLQKQFKFSISIAKSTILNLHDWTGVLAITQIYKVGSVSNHGRRGETLRGRVEGGYHSSGLLHVRHKLDVSASTHGFRK